MAAKNRSCFTAVSYTHLYGKVIYRPGLAGGWEQKMIKRSMGEKAYGLCNGAILVLLALVTLYPFLYVVFASVSDPVKLLGNTNMLLWPAGFTLNAYKKVFSNAATVSYTHLDVYKRQNRTYPKAVRKKAGFVRL